MRQTIILQALPARRLFLSAVALVAGAAASARAADVPPTTPRGITLVEVVRELPISQPEILWVRPGDPEGRTLLTFHKDEPGISNCVNDCATEFPPLAAPRNAKALGDWSVVRRKDGVRQWAYQSRPLYTWLQEQVPGEVATNVGLTETAGSKFAENAVEAGDLLPPEGWEVARFTPAESLTLPDGVDVSLVHSVHAVALTDAQGLTLYTLDRSSRQDQNGCDVSGCDNRWRPLAAPSLASGVGDFSVVTRKDGSNQWAYKNRPLYTFSGDELPGDAHGADVDGKWEVAVLTENFRPANVDSIFLEGYGAALTLHGKTLYGGYPFEKRWGGRNLRDTFTYAYYKGKRLNGAACQGECLETWRPFLAAANAQPSGFWEPVTREDGRRHWAYKGYALYTYAGDEAPGEHYGQATYDFANPDAEDFNFERVAMLQDISQASGGVGVYWNIAKP
jgi:predicted lipoprotein with Yx(FWY)xxD motif